MTKATGVGFSNCKNDKVRSLFVKTHKSHHLCYPTDKWMNAHLTEKTEITNLGVHIESTDMLSFKKKNHAAASLPDEQNAHEVIQA